MYGKNLFGRCLLVMASQQVSQAEITKLTKKFYKSYSHLLNNKIIFTVIFGKMEISFFGRIELSITKDLICLKVIKI